MQEKQEGKGEVISSIGPGHEFMHGVCLRESSPLPCPFCGGTAHIFKRQIHDTTPEPRRTLYWFVCSTYGCGVGGTHGEWSEARALEKWNRRTPART